ncbi:MAG: heme-binding domain-containing protein [Bacteroidota bacterium]
MNRRHFYWLTPLLGLLLWQLDRPQTSNPASHPEAALWFQHPAPPATLDLLRAACFDCHSNETVWPWYAHIQPIAGFVEGHVRQGRQEVNFSEWTHLSTEDRPHMAKTCAKLIHKQSMPLHSYTWLHPEAKLSEAERQKLFDYFHPISLPAP